MNIKITEEPEKEKESITFQELNYGSIFRYLHEERYYYGIKIVSYDIDGAEFNYTNLEDGDLYYIDPTAIVELYDDSLELKENKFIMEK